MRPVALLRAAHLGPTVAVTAVAALLAVAASLDAPTLVLVTAAVLAGQLTIGWSNDLLDARRDRLVGRQDKPLVTGELTTRLVSSALAVAALACVVLSFSVGWRSATCHLLLGVGGGLAYNLGLKATLVSWLPYAVAFGSLPAVVTLAAAPPHLPPWWMVVAGAALGVAAHFLNALPDFDDDAATGIRGLPHRLGQRVTQALATVALVVASSVVVLGPAATAPVWAWLALSLATALALVALAGTGRTPFRAAVAIALIDVALLTALSR